MIDKNYCMSSYLAYRYIEKDDTDFKEGIKHATESVFSNGNEILVYTAKDIAEAYKKLFEEKEKEGVKFGLLLSGGMDSACLAAFMKPGTDVYTFRFPDGFRNEEAERAALYAKHYGHKLHYVNINWEVVERNIDILMENKGAPVHSIEPQLYEAALQAKKDGVEMMVAADGSDLAFGGMDKMLSKDWSFDEWVKFYTFLDPKEVLKNPVDVNYVYEKYRLPDNRIDYIKFITEIFGIESSRTYCNAFRTADMKYKPFYDPSGMVKMAEPLDLKKIRSGESKYLIRELFRMCYPEIPVPEKIPMPRPVDKYFENWKGPTRPEFKDNLDMSKYTGNQKWQLWCLERFLNNIDNK